ncbi:MAG: dihydrofolate reductase [Chitinophagaceae bacterium]|nr:MAG: dihydrofolate reductase [Chitinophagaceae bacterium]
MRKIIVTEFITLDGVVEAPGGDETDHPHGGWNAKLRHPESGQYKVEELTSVDALLMGRKTYDQFAGYWPHQSGGGFADRINSLPKYIVSRSLNTTSWQNSQILREVATEVAALKHTSGGNILVYGSATLAKSLLDYHLVDKLTLMVHPVSVGGGLKLFDDKRDLTNFRLIYSRVLDNSVIILEYEPEYQPA